MYFKVVTNWPFGPTVKGDLYEVDEVWNKYCVLVDGTGETIPSS